MLFKWTVSLVIIHGSIDCWLWEWRVEKSLSSLMLVSRFWPHCSSYLGSCGCFSGLDSAQKTSVETSILYITQWFVYLCIRGWFSDHMELKLTLYRIEKQQLPRFFTVLKCDNTHVSKPTWEDINGLLDIKRTETVHSFIKVCAASKIHQELFIFNSYLCYVFIKLQQNILVCSTSIL